jgi:hypothetical protein
MSSFTSRSVPTTRYSLSHTLIKGILEPLAATAAPTGVSSTPQVVCSRSAVNLFVGAQTVDATTTTSSDVTSSDVTSSEAAVDSIPEEDDDSGDDEAVSEAHVATEVAALKTHSDVPSLLLPIEQTDSTSPPMALVLPTAILSPNLLSSSPNLTTSQIAAQYLATANLLPTAPVLVILLRSGRFAAGIFVGDRCVAHRATSRYTVRRGQGGSQSSNDSGKGKANSMGAQLRRAGEENLNKDVGAWLLENAPLVNNCSSLFLSVPNTMRKAFFDHKVIGKDDARIRSVPMQVKRPCFDSVKLVHDKFTSCEYRQMSPEELYRVEHGDVGDEYVDDDDVRAKMKEDMKAKQQRQREQAKTASMKVEVKEEVKYAAFTNLHNAAASCDLERVASLLQGPASLAGIDERCGALEETSLHLASASMSSDAAKCVTALLRAGANPVIPDSHGRTAYQVSSGDKVREAFRIVRGEVGEDVGFDWAAAKVSNDAKKKNKKANPKKARREKTKKGRARGELSSQSIAFLRGFGSQWVGPEGFL